MKNLLPKDGEVMFIPNFYTEEESNFVMERLINEIPWQQDQIKMYGKEINLPRLTSWFGEGAPYFYSGIKMDAHRWTPLLSLLKHKVEEDGAKVNFNSVLLNYYRDGKDSVSWHQDNETELGHQPTIASLTFGATRTFKFRHLNDKEVIKLELTNGSLVIMKGDTQNKWEHCIPKTSKIIGPRINLTFRIIS